MKLYNQVKIMKDCQFDLYLDDKHNRHLLENVHPSEWQNPQPQPVYNLVGIGAGTAGLISAIAAASLGGKVALVERHLMGGDCLNVGCVPSKALIRSSRLAHELKNAADFGLTGCDIRKEDFPRIMERMRRIRAEILKGYPPVQHKPRRSSASPMPIAARD